MKIADYGLVQNIKNNYVKSLTTGEITYLTPAMLQSLKRRELRPTHNLVKSDVYSTAITMLEIGTLMSAKNIYDMGHCMMNNEALD